MRERHYSQAIDVIRIISILGVIIIHTTTKALEVTGYDLVRSTGTLFLNQIFRFAVPLFFMISGFVLELNYSFHTSYVSYLKKRLSRIFIPYIFWSSLYYFFVYKNHSMSFPQSLIEGNASYQLYFIPTLLIFYIIFPVIHRYYLFIAKKWIAISLCLLQFFLLGYDYYVHPLGFFYPMTIALLNFYVFFLGIHAAHHREKILTIVEKWRITFFLITISFAVLIFFEGRNFYLKTHNYLSFYSQWRPSIFLYTIFLASSLYYLFNKNISHFSIIKILSKLSFLVFFIHVVILEILWNSIIHYIFQQTNIRIAENIWFAVLFSLSVACLSFLCAYIIHKIPKIIYITG